MSIYLRHRQIVTLYGHILRRSGVCWLWMSRLLTFMGFVSGLGVLLVANFQESNVLSVHLIGAMLAFGVGLLYCWGQTLISYAFKPRTSPLCIVHARLAFSIVGTVAFGASQYQYPLLIICLLQ